MSRDSRNVTPSDVYSIILGAVGAILAWALILHVYVTVNY